MKIINIIVSPEGETRVETKGFAGAECRDASRLLEAALGKRTSETLTAEYHEGQSGHSNRLNQGQ
jgi:hypothetical protein